MKNTAFHTATLSPSDRNPDRNVISSQSSSPIRIPSTSTSSSCSQPPFSLTLPNRTHANLRSYVKMEPVNFYTPSCRTSLLMPWPSSPQHPTSLCATVIPPLSTCHIGHSTTHHTTSMKLEHPISKSHTRRCREKISRGFDTLLSILPEPATGKKLKHKAQILEHTLAEFRALLRQQTRLQANLILASTATLASWASSTLANCAQKSREKSSARHKSSLTQAYDHLPTVAPSFIASNSPNFNIATILQQFIGLYCMSHGWPYAEVWLVQHRKNAPPVLSLSGSVYNVEDQDVAQKLEAFAEESRLSLLDQTSAVSGDVLYRVSLSGAPEWLSDFGTTDHSVDPLQSIHHHSLTIHNSEPNRDRSSLARKWGLRTALVIPSTEPALTIPAQSNDPSDAVIFLADLDTRLFNLTELEKLRAHLGVINDEFKRFCAAYVR